HPNCRPCRQTVWTGKAPRDGGRAVRWDSTDADGPRPDPRRAGGKGPRPLRGGRHITLPEETGWASFKARSFGFAPGESYILNRRTLPRLTTARSLWPGACAWSPSREHTQMLAPRGG